MAEHQKEEEEDRVKAEVAEHIKKEEDECINKDSRGKKEDKGKKEKYI